MTKNISTLRALLGAESWRPEDPPDFNAVSQEFRFQRCRELQLQINELQDELNELRHESYAQGSIDNIVKRTLSLSAGSDE